MTQKKETVIAAQDTGDQCHQLGLKGSPIFETQKR
jgi:hypothetical protein